MPDRTIDHVIEAVRLMNQWQSCWAAAAARGECDDLFGAEYRRVTRQWLNDISVEIVRYQHGHRDRGPTLPEEGQQP